MTETTHNSSAELHRVSCLRENFTSSSYGEELETGPATWSGTAPVPYPTAVLPLDQTDPLKIKHFLGTSENAVRIQIAVALIAFLLLRLAYAAQTAVEGLLAFTRLVRANLMHRRPIDRLLNPPPPIIKDQRQLILTLCQS